MFTTMSKLMKEVDVLLESSLKDERKLFVGYMRSFNYEIKDVLRECSLWEKMRVKKQLILRKTVLLFIIHKMFTVVTLKS